MNISQSFLKEFAEYKSGNTCGLQIKAKYIDGVKFPSTDAMELGNFFEYMATGSLPRDGHTPEPKIVLENFIQFEVLNSYLLTATDSQKLLINNMIEMTLSTNKQEEFLSLGEKIAINSLRKLNILV